jgi:hypothetical protein
MAGKALHKPHRRCEARTKYGSHKVDVSSATIQLRSQVVKKQTAIPEADSVTRC